MHRAVRGHRTPEPPGHLLYATSLKRRLEGTIPYGFYPFTGFKPDKHANLASLHYQPRRRPLLVLRDCFRSRLRFLGTDSQLSLLIGQAVGCRGFEPRFSTVESRVS